LTGQDIQSQDAQYSGDNGHGDRDADTEFLQFKKLAVALTLTSLPFLGLGLYLVSKGMDALGEVPERRANMLLYGGLMVALFVPAAFFVWVLFQYQAFSL
jgi:hypothetical protein